jgi:hypothetical protein
MIMLLVAGLLVTTSVSAYTLNGGVVQDASGGNVDGDYLGYIGDVNNELPTLVRNFPVDVGNPNWIGTDYIYTNQFGFGPTHFTSYQSNSSDYFPSDGSTVIHWYSFTVSDDSSLNAFYELGTDITSFTITFYIDGDDTNQVVFSKEFTTAELTGGSGDTVVHLYDYGFEDFLNGDYLIKIEGFADGSTNLGYKVQLFTSAVPLPPAALLFASALAGLGIFGRKKAGDA